MFSWALTVVTIISAELVDCNSEFRELVPQLKRRRSSAKAEIVHTGSVMPFKVTDVSTNQKPVCDCLLLVSNTNLMHIVQL